MRSRFLIVALCLSLKPAWAFDSVQLKKMIAPPAPPKFTPTALALDARQRLWAVDAPTGQLVIFSPGDVMTRVGGRGALPGQLNDPHSIAADSDGSVFVADAGNHRVQHVDASGKYIGSFGEKGTAPGQLDTPWVIAVSRDGLVVVADKNSGRVQWFTRDGLYLDGFDTAAPVNGLAIDASARIYVAHSKLATVEQWSPAGAQLQRWTGQEPGMKPFERPVELVVTSSGTLYVNDPDAHHFREMDLAGHTLGKFGRKGSGDGQFRRMGGLAVSDETLYVGDVRLHRVSVLELSHNTPAEKLPEMPLSRLRITRREPLKLAADRMAVGGDGEIYAISPAHDHLARLDSTGQQVEEWDLKKKFGIRNASGLAIARASGSLFISDANGNRVLKIDRSGKRLLEIGKSNHFFKGSEGELNSPRGISCSPQGVLFVADTGNARFQAFNHQGLFQFTGGSKGEMQGQLRTPVDVAWDHERLYVVDPGNKKVSEFSPSGKFIKDLVAPASETWIEPRQAVVDREGNVFVLDAARGRIVCFDAQGNYLGAFGRLGKEGGGFDRPLAIALSDSGDLFIACAGAVERLHIAVLPSAPTHLQATPGEGFVSLQWAGVASRHPVQYRVYRSAAGVAPQLVKETVETTATDDSLTPNTTYSFYVSAESGQGVQSGPSEPAIACAAPIAGPRLEIVSADIDDVFSADYKYYSRVPFGRVRIRNNGQGPVEKIKARFAIQGYMDYPTEVSIDELHAGEQKDVALLATFNNHILEVTETTPIQAQVTLSFYAGEQEKTFVRNLPFKLFSRNTIRWDKKDRLAAFITPNDPTIIDFARGVTTPFANQHKGAPVPPSILNAWALFEGLGVQGMSYLPRPNNPYDRASLDSSTVDTVQFARETLSRKSGDCADVVALLASMLESMTVTTAALDAPGHLFLMFDTGETDIQALGFPESMVVSYAGSYWIPVEATMVGSPFLDAWKKGAEEYHRDANAGTLTPIDIHMAWRTFEPATLPEMAVGVKPPDRDAIETKFLTDWKALVDLRWQTRIKALKGSPAPPAETDLQLGLLAVEFHRYAEAKEYFQKSASEKSTQAAAYNDLGNVALLQGNAAEAVQSYERAFQADTSDAGVSLNLARAYLKRADSKKAEEAFQRAVRLDASLRESYPDLSALAP